MKTLLLLLMPLSILAGPTTPERGTRVVNFRQLASQTQKHQTSAQVIGAKKSQAPSLKKAAPTLPYSCPVSLAKKRIALASPSGPNSYREEGAFSPPPQHIFTGIIGNQTVTPLNPGVACNANYIMQVSNQQYTIYNKQGDSLMSLYDDAFYNQPIGVNGIYDPKILFDAIANRWYICTGIGGYGATLAVTATCDPTGDWYIYHTVSIDSSVGFQDYPCMGYSDSLIVISCNDFINWYGKTPAPDYAYNSFFVINKYDALNGSLHYTQVIDTNKYGLYPAQNFDGTDTVWNVAYLESYQWTAYYYVSYFTGGGLPAYHAANLYSYNIGGNYYTCSEATQAGTANTIYTGDGRIQPTPSVRNCKLLFCNAMSAPDTGTPHYNYVQWMQIKPGNGELLQNGQVSDTEGLTTYFFPTVTCNSKSDILLAYNLTSDTNYISAAYSYHAHTDAPGYMEQQYLYASGVSPYFVNFNISGEPNRWGDNNMAAYDASTDGFVFVVEISNDTNAAGERIWYSGNYGDSRGEIGEYSPTADCYPPTGLTTAGVTANQVTFKWNAVPAGDTGLFYCSFQPNKTYTNPASITYYTNGTVDSFTFGELPSNYTLYWWLATVCGVDTSPLSFQDSVTTLNSPCGEPALSVSDISDTGALITVQQLPGISSYNLIFYSTAWQSCNLYPDNFKYLDSLNPCTEYDVFDVFVCMTPGDEDFIFYNYPGISFNTTCSGHQTPEVGLKPAAPDKLDTLIALVSKVSFGDLGANDAFKLFPNPAGNYLNIETAFGEPFELQVLDMEGQVLSAYKFSGSGVHNISTAGLANGVYVVRVLSEGGCFVRVVVVGG